MSVVQRQLPAGVMVRLAASSRSASAFSASIIYTTKYNKQLNHIRIDSKIKWTIIKLIMKVHAS